MHFRATFVSSRRLEICSRTVDNMTKEKGFSSIIISQNKTRTVTIFKRRYGTKSIIEADN